jgi:glycosyltransferase involved in cell wall biosynthesis
VSDARPPEGARAAAAGGASTVSLAEPTVSVIMPAWNAMRYIHAAIDSVLSQSYRDLELIVINDGSSDGDYAALQRIDPRVRVIDGARGGV